MKCSDNSRAKRIPSARGIDHAQGAEWSRRVKRRGPTWLATSRPLARESDDGPWPVTSHLLKRFTGGTSGEKLRLIGVTFDDGRVGRNVPPPLGPVIGKKTS